MLGKQVKPRRESIAIYRNAGREDRAEAEEAEAAILTEFLPQQLATTRSRRWRAPRSRRPAPRRRPTWDGDGPPLAADRAAPMAVLVSDIVRRLLAPA